MKPKNENAKNPDWKVPVNLPHVKPEDYPASQDATAGFSPKLGGHAKANHAHTSSFDAGPPDYTLPGYPTSKDTAGQEEGGKKRQPTTSVVGRVSKK